MEEVSCERWKKAKDFTDHRSRVSADMMGQEVSEGDEWRGEDSIREEVMRGVEKPVMEWKLRLQTVEQLHLEVLARWRLTVCSLHISWGTEQNMGAHEG